MLGRHHLLLSLATAFILVAPFATSNTMPVVMIIFGVAIGSLSPDGDSPDAAIFHTKMRGVKGDAGKFVNRYLAPIFPIFGYTIKYVIYKPSVFVLQKTLLKKYNLERHRGFLHSWLGIGVSSLVLSIYLLIVLLALQMLNGWYFLAFIAAYIFGSIMHLLEDSCTFSGIQWLFPFSKLRLHGKLITKPGDAAVPDAFTTILGVVAIGYFFAFETGYIPLEKYQAVIASALTLFVIWSLFVILIARAKITNDDYHFHKNVKSMT